MPPQPTVPPPQTVPSTPSAPPPKKKLKLVVLILACLLVLGIVVGGGYYYMKKMNHSTHNKPAPTVANVTVPKDAIVTAECVAGRGKQYILTKDIPDGPIYDVVNGNVVAIEYLVGLNDLVATPSKFSDLMLDKGQYDHLALVPTEPHAGMTGQHFHAIAYLVSVDQAKAITCTNGAASSTMDMSHGH